MLLENPWVGYFDRTYAQIKQKLVDRLIFHAPEITDLSEGNPLIAGLSHVGGISEVLHSYLDNLGRESFLGVARKWSSIVRLLKPLDYPIQLARPASVEVFVEFQDSSSNPIASNADYILPAGTQIKTSSNIIFVTVAAKLIPSGNTSILLDLQNHTLLTDLSMGFTSGLSAQSIPLGNNIVRNSISLSLGLELWEEVDTFAYSGTTSQHFLVDIDEDRIARLYFGDGINGQIPAAGQEVIIDLLTTIGAAGNGLLPNTINAFVTLPPIPGVSKFLITHALNSNGGSNYESFDEARRRGPLSIRTLRRFVTYPDGSDLAVMYPGVYFSKLEFCCGIDSDIQVYVGPTGGGIASQQLLDEVKDYLESKQVIGMPNVKTRPAGISTWGISIDATARFRQRPEVCMGNILTAIREYGSYENSGVNKAIRVSDILGLVDNLRRIDYANVTALYTIPYPRPVNHVTPLNFLLNSITQTHPIPLDWRVETSIGGMRIFRGNVFIGTFNIGANITDNIHGVVFTILPGPYSVGMTWTFKTIPVNVDQVLVDYSIPVIGEPQIYINVNPAKGDNCKPCCTC